MLRITALSLLLGLAILAVAVTQLFSPRHSAQQDTPAIIWNPSKVIVVSGTPALIGDDLHIELDSEGAGLITLDTMAIEARNFSFIKIALDQSSKKIASTIVWSHEASSNDTRSYTLESKARGALWLATDELRNWEGEIATLGLQFSGRAGDTVVIRDFSLYPSSPIRQLLAIYSDLTSYASWNSSSMNTYTGAFDSSSFYPITLAVALLICCLLVYGSILLLLPKKLSFQPSVVALIFFAVWIILDMFWQYRLLNQLAETRETFSGKSTEEKLAVGPDAELFKFVSRTRPLLGSTNSRIFVASSDSYSGMRAAYYFYPLNVYWSLYGPALPHNTLLRKGDYVVMVEPSPFQFDRKRNQVTAPNRGKLKAEFVFADTAGTVVRLK